MSYNLFKGMIKCKNCGCTVTPEPPKKGKYIYLRPKPKNGCNCKQINETVANKLVEDTLKSMTIPEDVLEMYLDKLKQRFETQQHNEILQKKKKKQDSDNAKKRLERLLDLYLAEDIDIAISKIKATIVGSKAINNKISNIEVLDIENEETASNILRQKFHNIIFVGDGAIVHQEKLKTAFDFNVVPDSNIASATSTTSILVQFAEDNYNLQNSNSVAKSALCKYNQGNFGYSSSISPIYLKKSQAERALEEKIKIMPMHASDIDAITPNFETEFDKFWNINTLRNDFSNPNSTYIIAKIDDEIVGFAGFLKICDEANIMNIVTKVDKRHLGIGSKLMQALIDEAKKQNLTSITLEVNDKNFQAIKLYEKFGFKRIGLRKKYYNNTDDAIIMSL